jgi:2-amino-4-hydroxy-6-hydroxymethyldihydropteridine diphosphokinase
VSRFAIGLGSNLGDRLEHLFTATREIEKRLGRLLVSPVYETEPVGGPDQDPFLNAVATVETVLDPIEVLDVCQDIELMLGRRRKERWGPRTLDLDIVTSDGPPVAVERLTIPHPRAAEREFVLRPLADVWPDAPVGPDRTASSALESIPTQGVDRLATDWMPPVSRWRPQALLAAQFLLIMGVAVSVVYDGEAPDGDRVIVSIIGALVALIGVVTVAVASRQLGPAITATPIPKPGAQLVTSGLYRFARHPIYGGLSLLMIGAALVFGSRAGLVIAALLPPFFIMKASYEERQLRLRYAGYFAYRKRVTKWLIPFVV